GGFAQAIALDVGVGRAALEIARRRGTSVGIRFVVWLPGRLAATARSATSRRHARCRARRTRGVIGGVVHFAFLCVFAAHVSSLRNYALSLNELSAPDASSLLISPANESS